MSAVTSVETGSSPLARGLRPERPLRRRPNRIIPARAGFTATWTPSARPSPDHPRSRGVYSPTTAFPEMVAGSSPLARGLRRLEAEVLAGDGIIPARAGFTRESSRPCPGRRDHPRSRGVYGLVRQDDPDYEGSSPLARGLPVLHEPDGTLRRIIPARAGFTTPNRAPSFTLEDHPRSRGVYRRSRRQRPRLVGSSPLARGLRRHRCPAVRPGGIIPARAGFTTRMRPSSPTSPDHPRSRGVYDGSGRPRGAVWGSSPLARGLRSLEQDADTVTRIIPARAGFTYGTEWVRDVPWDHPRSRGVYVFLVTRP